MSHNDPDRAAVTGGAISVRPATADDYDFQRLLYHDTRAEEMTQFPFNDEQKVAFLDWQFSLQHTHYQQHYPGCEWNIIEQDGKPIGRLIVDRWRDQIRIVDIALMAERRGTGIGSSLLRELLDEGRASGLPVTIHVESMNPAMRLYHRLGFVKRDTSGAYDLMRWTPDQVNTAS